MKVGAQQIDILDHLTISALIVVVIVVDVTIIIIIVVVIFTAVVDASDVE